jgi:hypothetical protein
MEGVYDVNLVIFFSILAIRDGYFVSVRRGEARKEVFYKYSISRRWFLDER